MQPRVLGLIHHAHTTPAQYVKDVAVPDGLSDQLEACRFCMGI